MKEERDTLEGLARKRVAIVTGTHRLAGVDGHAEQKGKPE